MIIDFDLEYFLLAEEIKTDGIKVKTMSGCLVQYLEVEDSGQKLTGVVYRDGYLDRFTWSLDGKLGLHPTQLDLCIEINPEKIL